MHPCRICYDEEGALITPCDCKGSAGSVHASCLYDWLQVSQSPACEICHASYGLFEPTYTPFPVELYFTRRSHWMLLVMYGLYIEYLCIGCDLPFQIPRTFATLAIYGNHALSVMPFMLIGVLLMQAAILNNARPLLKDTARFLEYLSVVPTGMTVTPATLLMYILGSVILSFHIPVAGACISVHLTSQLYDTYLAVIGQINRDVLV